MAYKFFVGVLLLAMSFSLQAVKYSGQQIAEDDVAEAIKPPGRPPSVTQAIDHIRKNHDLNELRELDLSCNVIGLNGARRILSFVYDELPNLETLDLSHNYIYDWRGVDDYEAFELQLVLLLRRDTFRSIDLSVNNIASLNWFQHMTEKYGDVIPKIKWKNDE